MQQQLTKDEFIERVDRIAQQAALEAASRANIHPQGLESLLVEVLAHQVALRLMIGEAMEFSGMFREPEKADGRD